MAAKKTEAEMHESGELLLREFVRLVSLAERYVVVQEELLRIKLSEVSTQGHCWRNLNNQGLGGTCVNDDKTCKCHCKNCMKMKGLGL